MAEERMMTEAEYDAQLRQWTAQIHSKARLALVVGTHSSGRLAQSIQHYVDKMRDGEGRHIAFRFEPYGVFRQYGAGRGWVVVNGVPVPGYRVVSLKDRYKVKNWGTEAMEMLKRGYSHANVKSAKKIFEGVTPERRREPLDWLDGRIQAGAQELGDIAQSYWGDTALKSIAEQIQGAKIVKT